jgi:RNA polymerase sigma-70 factor (ECF subfamily)
MAERDILSDFLGSLNEVDASIMMMTLDGMTPAEIEEVIGTSANAITIRINRIKQKYIDVYIE